MGNDARRDVARKVSYVCAGGTVSQKRLRRGRGRDEVVVVVVQVVVAERARAREWKLEREPGQVGAVDMRAAQVATL